MNLSQSEINKMLGITSGNLDFEDEDMETLTEGSGMPSGDFSTVEIDDMVIDETFDRSKYSLSPEEMDILGEIGNMCMGAVATTMYTLLDRPVKITTPRVSVHTTREVLSAYRVPFVIVEVEYTSGIEGKNVLLLKEPDAALITDLLMGGDGNVSEPIELSELHMSAVSEIMNQMIGASATALSQIIQNPVDISTPSSDRVFDSGEVSTHMNESDVVVRICFDMEIEGLLRSQLLQLMPYNLGRSLSAKLMSIMMGESAEQVPPPAPAVPPVQPQTQPLKQPQYQAPPQYQQERQYPQAPYQTQYAPGYQEPPARQIDVKTMNYQNFGPELTYAEPQAFNMVHDIPLKVSVELGRTTKQINEILGFSTGTVIVLDKSVGDPVEIMANGKLIARGEVVAIEENYGVRITDIFT